MSLSPTERDLIAELSERQRDCLRLLYQNYNAKQIGRKLGISPHTVHRHLQDARRLTGITRSMDLAIILVRHDGGERLANCEIAIDPSGDLADETKAAARNLSKPAVRNRVSLGVIYRIGTIVAIAVGAVALAGALGNGLEQIAKIFRAEGIDISDYPYRQ